MLDVIVDCHKCKYEYNGKCVPRSQAMKFPNCYKSRQTHADRFRAMTDEEMAEYFSNLSCHEAASREFCIKHEGDCTECWLDWLKQEVQE